MFPAWDPTALRLVAPMRGIANLSSQPPHRGILRISPTNILLTHAIRQFVKEKLELIMREEIKHFLEIEQADTSNMMAGLKVFWSLETETENFKPNCSLLTNATRAGLRKPSSGCIKVA
jgi:hypothetical protein